MTTQEKIDYMIQTLQIAKEELNYSEIYKKSESDSKSLDDNYASWEFYHTNRRPNSTLVSESLKNVGRMAFILDKEIKK